MKAAEKGSGPRVRGTHQDILGRPMLGDRSCVDEQDMVGDIAGEGDLVRHDNHRGAVFAELPHDREHFSDQFEIERRGDLVEQLTSGDIRCRCRFDQSTT